MPFKEHYTSNVTVMLKESVVYAFINLAHAEIACIWSSQKLVSMITKLYPIYS